MIVGAWALAFHGRPRYTGDLDIFVDHDEENAVKLMEVIEDFGFGSTGITREDFLQADYVIQLGQAPNRIDLLTGISGVSFKEAWDNRENGNIAELEVPFINREVNQKQASSKPRQRSRGYQTSGKDTASKVAEKAMNKLRLLTIHFEPQLDSK